MKRFFLSTIIATLLLGFSACDDALDLDPKSDISPADYFKNETQLQLFSNSFYNNLLEKEPYDAQSDVYVQRNLSELMILGSRRTVPASGSGWSWGDLRKMNTLIAYAATNCPDQAAVTKYTALCHFFRAYFYFEKVKRFGDVPWIDKELGSADSELYNPRDSREFIMTKMIEDIDDAIANLPTKAEEKSAPYRVTKYAALALKARFCLFEGTFRKYHKLTLEGHDANYYLTLAAEAANELMTSGAYKLFSTGDVNKDYLTLFTQENASTDEYILAIRFDHGLGIYHDATGTVTVPSGGRPGLTRKVVNTYLMKDGTAFTDKVGWQEMQFLDEVKDRDPRLAQTIRTPGYCRPGTTAQLANDLSMTVTGYQIAKWVQNPSLSGGQIDRSNRSTCDIPVYRYAEVLLNYAEAKAELGTLTQEDLDRSVNVIRKRVGMPNLSLAAANANPDRYLSDEETGYPGVEGANKGVILEIRRERTIELMAEGFRFYDIVRWKAGKCFNAPVTGMFIPGPGEYDFTGDGKANVVLYAAGTSKPTAAVGVPVLEIGTDILLTNETYGYILHGQQSMRSLFNEGRDYLYPIPSNERSLNHNLTQNPGWDDGLDF